MLRYGTPIEARQGLHKSLQISYKKLMELFNDGEDAILAEITQNTSTERDALGWSDGEWLHYVLSQPSEEKTLPAGFLSKTLDKGHKGMTLDDYVKLPQAVAADLDRATVLALRLYTTPVFKSINKPLREGCKHPYPALVAHLVNGIAKLCALNTKEDPDARPVEIYRGLKIDAGPEFYSRGATELAFMSAMRLEKKVAEKVVSTDGASASVLMRLNLTREQLGADISFLSCFPAECEYLYGPGTYIEPKAERGGAFLPGAVKVVEGQIHIKEQPIFKKASAGERAEAVEDEAAGAATAAPIKPSK